MASNDKPDENSKDARRVYYDHEPAYEAIAEAGGKGWDDLPSSQRGEFDAPEEGDSYVALERFLASSWAPPEGARAIEFGCGGGQATLRLAEHGYKAVGVDYSETAIELARHNLERTNLEHTNLEHTNLEHTNLEHTNLEHTNLEHNNAEEAELDCEFFVGDVTDLEQFDDDAFDLVVDNHCLHCLIELADREAFLREATRLLRPGGIFFSETMTREGDFDPEMLDVNPQTFVSSANTRIFVSKLELDQELRGANFNIIHTYTRHQEPGVGYTFVNYALAR